MLKKSNIYFLKDHKKIIFFSIYIILICLALFWHLKNNNDGKIRNLKNKL